MNANELRPLLAEYRSKVEQAWTAKTAHHHYVGQTGSPVGQCGATSAWLRRRLRDDLRVETSFVLGELRGFGDRPIRHCWLETADHWIVDLTADQIPGAPKIVCAYWPRTVVEHDLSYSVGMFMYDLSDQTDLLERADLLAEAVNA